MDNIPTSFAFSLAMNKNANDYYNSLDLDTQTNIINYINTSNNLEETKSRINESITALSNSDTNFLFFL